MCIIFHFLHIQLFITIHFSTYNSLEQAFIAAVSQQQTSTVSQQHTLKIEPITYTETVFTQKLKNVHASNVIMAIFLPQRNVGST